MPNVLPIEQPGPDSFYLMYLNTGCGNKLKYNNKVFICNGSMWNNGMLYYAQAKAIIFAIWLFLRNSHFFVADNVSFQGNTHS